jgi:hypothetical protein
MLAVMRFAVGQLSEADLPATVPGQDAASGSESAYVAHSYIGAKGATVLDAPQKWRPHYIPSARRSHH